LKLSNEAVARNEAIIAHIESIGGGCVWEEYFAVSLMDVAATDRDVADLPDLRGVQQIALDALNLSFPVLVAIARIPGLESLVLSHAALSDSQLQTLQAAVAEVVLVEDED